MLWWRTTCRRARSGQRDRLSIHCTKHYQIGPNEGLPQSHGGKTLRRWISPARFPYLGSLEGRVEDTNEFEPRFRPQNVVVVLVQRVKRPRANMMNLAGRHVFDAAGAGDAIDRFKVMIVTLVVLV